MDGQVENAVGRITLSRILVCGRESGTREHVFTLPALAEFRPRLYRSHVFRVPDLLQLEAVFRRGWYDRVVCSTELLMGLAALYLKAGYTVPAFFYVHTDWLDFADKSLGFDVHARDRVRRLLRAFHRSFDGLIVLNSEQSSWLAGPEMGIEKSKIFASAHWAEEWFSPQPVERSEVFPSVGTDEKVLLFVGRISEEKGIFQLPAIYNALKPLHPAVRFALAGEGPAQDRLRASFPEALYLGRVDSKDLPRLYSASDLLVLPSRFDTFGCAVLEAMSCGLPVVAYDTKGPGDIIRHGVNGFLTESEAEFPAVIANYLKNPQIQQSMRMAAVETGSRYRPGDILERLLEDIGLSRQPKAARTRGRRPPRKPRTTKPAAGEENSFLGELLELVSK